jgi:hypothetical protein
VDVQRTSRKDRLDTSAELNTANVVVWEPEQGDHLWVFPESEDKLGSGGEFHIYVG